MTIFLTSRGYSGMGQTTMRAVRIECSPTSIRHDSRIEKALESVSWDYRGSLGIINGKFENNGGMYHHRFSMSTTRV